jgi:signal transduction histidine kinase
MIQNEKMAALGVLISSVAHEINNPVNFISFNLPILREYMEELLPLIDDYVKKHLEYEIYHMPYAEFRKDLLNLIDNLDHGAERIKAVVSNLKEFNRTNYVVQEKRVDLNQVMQSVLQANRLRALKKINVFEKKIPEDLPKVWSDPYAIEQILVNLLTNAAHACDKETSKVTLSIKIQEAWQERIVITVKDNGVGMSEETRRKIFDPFFTTKSVVDGTGLGLFVCHGLVQSLGGRIEVESEPGKGSTFTVFLPDNKTRRN